MKTLLSEDFLRKFDYNIEKAEINNSDEYPPRQPVHVVYGGADKFKYNTSARLGNIALKTLEEYADNDKIFFEALGLHGYEFSDIIYKRVIEKLKSEPVEDFRIDFEDGFGIRSNDEEDKTAEFTAKETAKGMLENLLPPFLGVRIKPFDSHFIKRAVRTLDIYLTTLLSETNGKLPENFLITLPKISSGEHVKMLVDILNELELSNSLPKGKLKFEIMIETPEIIFNKKGEFVLPGLVSLCEGRCFSAHFGAYDFTSALDITAGSQSLSHPLCDFVRNYMKLGFAGSGIFLSDGATNILPFPKFKNENLTEEQKNINKEMIYNSWKTSFNDIQNSLHSGFYQGWDLHPAQIPVRYAAVYSFFLNEIEKTTKRLKGFVDKAAQVSLSGNVFDDAASAQALLNFFIRGLNCSAITEEEIKKTGLTVEEIKTQSFLQILENRKLL